MLATSDSIQVLHVDDEPSFADLTETVLEQEDDRFAVESATSADEGLNLLGDRPPDCIVSDYNMPGKDGLEFLRVVREKHPDLPFILFTGRGSEAVASEAISAGVTDYLQKSSGTEQYELLANRIRNAVEARRETQRARKQEQLMRLTEFAGDIGGFELDIETDEVRLTDGANRILDLPEDSDLTVENGLELFHPDDRTEIREVIDRAMENGGQARGTWRYYPPDGQERYLDVTFTPATTNGDERTLRGAIHDVTDRKDRQRELEQTETLFEHAQDSLFLIRVAGGFAVERVNTAWEETTGLSAERVRGQTPTELLGEQQGEAVEARYRECVERREPLEYTEQLQFDGEPVQWETKIAPVVVDGTVEYIAGSTRDITEQQRQQRELRLLQQAIDDANVPITLADPSQEDEPLVYVNSAFEKMTGYLPEEMLGRNCRFLQGEGTDPEKVAALREAIDAEESLTVELRNYRKDGTEFWNRLTVTPIYDNGDLVRFLGTQDDVTDRKEREEALERLHASTRQLMRTTSTEAVAATGAETATQVLDLWASTVFRADPTDGELVPVGWSDETETFFDGSPPTLPVDDSLAGRTYRTGEPAVYADVREAAETYDPETEFRSELHVPIGDYGVLVSGSTTADEFDAEDRALARILGANLDVALDRVERTRELERQNERLEEFTSIVSHDLRNPLNMAKLGVDLARDESDSPHLDEAQRGIDRSLALIEDLLTLARDGEQVGPTEPVALESAVTDAWETVETGAATLDLEAETTVYADSSRLQQLLVNLVENAVVHGGADVAVTVAETTDGFVVADDGPGLPDDGADSVFDAGYSTAESGTGFGLRIVEQVASGHGWDVSVTDGEDRGARFEITGVDTVEVLSDTRP